MSAGEVVSRDGKWTPSVSYPDATLWRSRVDGSERLRLTFSPVSAFLPHWSPDGTQIAYTNRQAGAALEEFSDLGARRDAIADASREGRL